MRKSFEVLSMLRGDEINNCMFTKGKLPLDK